MMNNPARYPHNQRPVPAAVRFATTLPTEALRWASTCLEPIRVLMQKPISAISLVFLIAIASACFLGEALYPKKWDEIDFVFEALAPSWEHPLGTDDLGRDLLARLLYGGRISLTVGIITSVCAGILGILIGAAAGYFGGLLDTIVTIVIDFMYSLPYYFIIVLIMVFFDVSSIMTLFIILALFKWLSMARIARGQVLSMRQSEFVLSMRSMGFSHRRILLLHIIPGCLGVGIVYTTLMVPGVMMQEAFLSFIGLTFQAIGSDGVAKPVASWGTLLSEGARIFETAPWLLVFPGLAFTLTLLAINFIGDTLRDWLDPNT
jgi:oligopeptide transport system permease protein